MGWSDFHGGFEERAKVLLFTDELILEPQGRSACRQCLFQCRQRSLAGEDQCDRTMVLRGAFPI